jgi:hypothetical protein
MMTYNEINKKHMSDIRDFLDKLYYKAENCTYSYQFSICLHEIQYEYENIVIKHQTNLRNTINENIEPNDFKNYNEINIYEIYQWLDNIIYKLYFTENKSIILNWIKQPLCDLKLTTMSSKVRLRCQREAPDWTQWLKGETHQEYMQKVIKNQNDYKDYYKMVLRQTCFIHNCETARYLYDLEKSPVFSNNADESDLKYEQAYIANKIIHQQSALDRMMVAFHIDEIIERPRFIHAEYALKTLERKSLLFKTYSEEAAKVVKRLVIETYMGDCYRPINID